MINIEKYTRKISMWESLKRYLIDNRDFYMLDSSISDEELLLFIRRLARSSIKNNKDFDSFRHALANLQAGKTICLNRINQLRLCFALKCSSVDEANNLFLNYLHVNELSARSLDEFLIICGLKCGLSFSEISSMQDKYKEQIDNQPLAPFDQLTPDQTKDFISDIVVNGIHSKEDIINYLSKDANLAFFSKTRNLHYMSLFDDITINIDNGTVSFIDDFIAVRNEITLRAKSNRLTILEYYNNLFHLHSLDGDCSNNYLDDSDVAVLLNIFDEAFMTYDNFCDLVQRKRPIDISAGTYLLHILITIDAVEIDITDSDKFKTVCNEFLNNAGFPSLNVENNTLDAFIMDVHNETSIANPGLSSSDFKKIYLANLRHYLKLIAHPENIVK